ncbi:hypothetical protein Cob_v000964 [Colletotrichum orbiculare MAFF 240422]|uniref:Uncharacterized protein n=1 Tax=Colletotrichum orbiculare (strain 104-T / ATCC 96160 / CBS 514.97 / LARS 414 / MAFF 240422) TaxID=1213857 RepID=A0A484G8D0_COLOR|nr:hypothetical protein Cob_v000964 [Colletotrichum orbiculare MAFF 240422]
MTSIEVEAQEWTSARFPINPLQQYSPTVATPAALSPLLGISPTANRWLDRSARETEKPALGTQASGVSGRRPWLQQFLVLG